MPEQKNAGREAREQAKAYESVFAPIPLKLDDGTVILAPPHPNLQMLDDDAQAALECLEFELESYDRHDDVFVPEQKVKDRSGNEITLPAQTRPGAVKIPYRKTEDGVAQLLDPPYTVRVVQIALGEDDYATLRAGTIDGRRGCAADVWRAWNERGQELGSRADADDKSDDGADDLEDLATPDGQ